MSRDAASDAAKAKLIGYIRRLRALRDQRRDINADMAEVRKEAKNEGFDAKRIEMVVRWQEECEDKGREIVDEGEALFELYRSVVDGEGRNLSDLMDDARDRALLKIFAPDDQADVRGPTKKVKAVNDALAMAQANRALRDFGRGDR
jgi:uncharacterized protein (UPF0335 family)